MESPSREELEEFWTHGSDGQASQEAHVSSTTLFHTGRQGITSLLRISRRRPPTFTPEFETWILTWSYSSEILPSNSSLQVQSATGGDPISRFRLATLCIRLLLRIILRS